MATAAAPGQLVDANDRDATVEPKPKLLVNCEPFRVMRLVLPQGKEIAEHSAPRQIMVQCISGQVHFTAMEQTHAMTPGTLLFLEPGEPHSLIAIDDSVMLVTLAN